MPIVAIIALHLTGERRVDRSAAIKFSKKLTTSTVIIHLNMLGMFVKYHTSLNKMIVQLSKYNEIRVSIETLNS